MKSPFILQYSERLDSMKSSSQYTSLHAMDVWTNYILMYNHDSGNSYNMYQVVISSSQKP